MNRFTELRHHIFPVGFVVLTFALYALAYAGYYAELEIGVASLAIVPVIVAGWSFGIGGGITLAVVCVLAIAFLHMFAGDSIADLFSNMSTNVRMLSLFLAAIATGALSSSSGERSDAIRKLEQYEKDRQAHTRFLELLLSKPIRSSRPWDRNWKRSVLPVSWLYMTQVVRPSQ